MAVWGVPVEIDTHPEHIANTALHRLSHLRNESWESLDKLMIAPDVTSPFDYKDNDKYVKVDQVLLCLHVRWFFSSIFHRTLMPGYNNLNLFISPEVNLYSDTFIDTFICAILIPCNLSEESSKYLQREDQVKLRSSLLYLWFDSDRCVYPISPLARLRSAVILGFR